MLLLTTLLALAPPPAPTAAATEREAPTDPVAVDLPTVDAGLPPDYEPPFAAETLQLSDVLQRALQTNIDLRSNAIDVGISEANVMTALGAYDVFLSAALNGTVAKTPQRGSQITFATGNRSLGLTLGFQRKLEIGGTVSLRIDINRSQQDQKTGNFLAANAATTTLSTYRITPTLTLTQPLLKGAGLKVNRADINKAKLAVNAAQATQILTAQNLVRDLISAYWDVLFAHRDLQNKRNSVAPATRQLERTKALVAAGRTSPVDAKAVEQALAARESDVLTAENTLLDRSLTLRTLMGESFDGSGTFGVLPATDPLVKARTVNLSDEIDRALKQNPQVRQLEIQIASGRIDELVAANQRLPQLDFSGSFTPQGRSTDTSATAQTGDPGREGSWGEAFQNFFNKKRVIQDENRLLADWTLQGSLTLTWDVQNRTAKGRHQAAKLQIKKAQVNLERAKQTVATGVIRAANGLRTAGKVMEVAQISVDLAKDNLAAEQARYDVGRSTNYDVLLRLDELDKAQASALSAQVTYLKALAQLQALAGEILPAYGLDTP
ncbi:MAG: TolC family protein [Deltaproteobacteria bacterium]|nr:TolC family protein [Deltaproteobacteria bacterium]